MIPWDGLPTWCNMIPSSYHMLQRFVSYFCFLSAHISPFPAFGETFLNATFDALLKVLQKLPLSILNRNTQVLKRRVEFKGCCCIFDDFAAPKRLWNVLFTPHEPKKSTHTQSFSRLLSKSKLTFQREHLPYQNARDEWIIILGNMKRTHMTQCQTEMISSLTLSSVPFD